MTALRFKPKPTHETVACPTCGKHIMRIDWLGMRILLEPGQQPADEPVNGFELYDRAWHPVQAPVNRRRGYPIHRVHGCADATTPREGA